MNYQRAEHSEEEEIMLSLLTGCLADQRALPEHMSGTIEVPQGVTVSTLSTLTSSRPLVNSLGGVPFEEALFALNVSGLAEAHLYVKRFRELSNGQRYRAMVAKLIASSLCALTGGSARPSIK